MVNAPVSTTLPTIAEGDTGSAVVELQKRLNKKGFNLTADGVFGRVTKNAVVQFQKQNQLVADGVVGPRTWKALENVPVPAPIRLVDICRYYDPVKFPHQTAAIEWLQTQLSPATLDELSIRWRKSPQQ